MLKLFMVEFELPSVMTEEFLQLIPRQREYINYLMAEGKIQSYSLSSDRSRLWVVFAAETDFEVLETISQFPLGEYLTPEINELAFHNSQSQVLQFSLN